MPNSVFGRDQVTLPNAVFNNNADASGIHFVLEELDVSMSNIAATILSEALEVVLAVDVVVPLDVSASLFQNYFIVSADGTDVTDNEANDICYNAPTAAAALAMSTYLSDLGTNFRSKDVSAGRVIVEDLTDTTVGANYVRFIVEKMFGNANLVDLINNEDDVRQDISFSNLQAGLVDNRLTIAEKLWKQLMKAGEEDNYERLKDLSGTWAESSSSDVYTTEIVPADRKLNKFPFRQGDTFSFRVIFKNNNTTVTGEQISGNVTPGEYHHRVVLRLV